MNGGVGLTGHTLGRVAQSVPFLLRPGQGVAERGRRREGRPAAQKGGTRDDLRAPREAGGHRLRSFYGIVSRV